MPQLNPAPWFLTFLTSWVILLILLTPKLSTTNLPSQPKLEPNMHYTTSWTWPWL